MSFSLPKLFFVISTIYLPYRATLVILIRKKLFLKRVWWVQYKMATSFVKSPLYQEGKHKYHTQVPYSSLGSLEMTNHSPLPPLFICIHMFLKMYVEVKWIPHEWIDALLQSESGNMHGTKRMDCFSHQSHFHPVGALNV